MQQKQKLTTHVACFLLFDVSQYGHQKLRKRGGTFQNVSNFVSNFYFTKNQILMDKRLHRII